MQIKEINLIESKITRDNQLHRLKIPQQVQIKETNLIEVYNLIEIKIKLVVSLLHAIIKKMIIHLQTNQIKN